MENGHLIQAVATYTGAIEKRLKDLETRVGELEKKLNASQAAEAVQQDLIDELEQRIAELEARPMTEIPEEVEAEDEQTIDEGIAEEENKPEETPEEETSIKAETIEVPEDEEVAFVGIEDETPATKTAVESIAKAMAEVTPKIKTEPMAEVAPVSEPIAEVANEAKTEQKEVATETVEAKPAAEKAADKPAETPKTTAYGKPVSDLGKAISIGDRFLFQRELFDKNAELMQRTIADLNSLSTFGEAVEYLQQHFDWDKELPSYELFMTALHRRFGE